MAARRVLLALLSAAALGACVQIEYDRRLPTCDAGAKRGDRCGFYFPTGAARAGDHLVVASSNFDLRYLTAGVSSYSIAAIDAAADAATSSGGGVPRAPIPSPESTVLVGDFAADVAATSTGTRVFVPVRSRNEVLAIDVGADGRLSCARAGGADAFPGGAEARRETGEKRPFCVGEPFPAQDPSQVLVLGDHVYVGHAQARASENGLLAAAKADAQMWSTGKGKFLRIPLSTTAVGGLAGRTFPGGGSVYLTGRTTSGQRVVLYAFDFLGADLITSPLYTGDLSPQTEGRDARGIAIDRDGSRAFIAYRAPEAIAAVDLTRLPAPVAQGCTDPPPPGGCGTSGAPGVSVPVPAFDVTRVLPAPAEPRTLTTVPRTLPDGTSSDLVVLAYREGLAFLDTRTGRLSGQVDNAGELPVGIVVVPRGAGARIYAPLFATGRLAVVDLPDLFSPSTARLTALLGDVQETYF